MPILDLEIKGVAGCYVNGKGNLPNFDSKQYVSLLLRGDPTTAIDDGSLRVFFEHSDDNKMTGTSDSSAYVPFLRAGKGRPCVDGANVGFNVEYQQWQHHKKQKYISLDGNAMYTTQIIVLNGFIVTPTSEANSFWLHIPAPALPMMATYSGGKTGVPNSIEETPPTGNYRVVLDTTGKYGLHTGGVKWPPIANMRYGNSSDGSNLGRAPANMQITQRPNSGRGSSGAWNPFGSSGPFQGGNKVTATQDGNNIPVGDEIVKENGVEDIGNTSMSRARDGHTVSEPSGDTFELTDVAYGSFYWRRYKVNKEESDSIALWGRTGVLREETSAKSWEATTDATHNNPNIGVIFFHNNEAGGKQNIPKPIGCTPGVVFHGLREIPQNTAFEDWDVASSKKLRVFFKDRDGGSNSGIIHMMLEAEITDKFGINRVFYVPFITKGLIANPLQKTKLGSRADSIAADASVFGRVPSLAQFDPYSGGYFPKISEEILGSQAWMSFPFLPMGPDGYNNTDRTPASSRRFGIWLLNRQAVGSYISPGKTGKYPALEYLQNVLTGSFPSISPREGSVSQAGPDSVRVKGNFAKYFKYDKNIDNQETLVPTSEIDAIGFVQPGGVRIPQVAIGLNLKSSASDLQEKIAGDQAGQISEIEVQDDGSFTGLLPSLPGLPDNILCDMSIHTKLRNYGTGLIIKDQFTATQDATQHFDITSITPPRIPNTEGTEFLLNGAPSPAVVDRVTLVPIGGEDPIDSEVIELTFRDFDLPKPGGLVCKLPRFANDGSTRVDSIIGMHDLYIVGDLGSETFVNAIELTAVDPAHIPEIYSVEPSSGRNGLESVFVRSAKPGEITEENVYSIYLGSEHTGIQIQDPMKSSADVPISNFIEGGKIVGIVFNPPEQDLGGDLNQSPPVPPNSINNLDLIVRTKINPGMPDSQITQENIEFETLKSVYLNAYTINPTPLSPPPEKSGIFPIVDPTGVFHSIPLDSNPGRIDIMPLSGINETNDLQNQYGKDFPIRNTIGIGKSIENDNVIQGSNESIQVESSVQSINEIAENIGTRVYYDEDNPSDSPASIPKYPIVICCLTNETRLGEINSSTPAMIREDLLVIPDEKIDALNTTGLDGSPGGFYSYLAGFNFDSIPDDYALIIQNINSNTKGNKFGLKKLITNDGINRFDDLGNLEIPPGYYAVHSSGYYVAINLVGVFNEYKLIREAIIYFAQETDLDNASEYGQDNSYNGYGGSSGNDLLDKVRFGHATNFESLEQVNWENLSQIPSRNRYVLILHDSLVGSYLYPGTVDLKIADSLGIKQYAASEISVNSDIETSVELGPDIKPVTETI